MATKVIRMRLTTQSIDAAIREVSKYRQDLITAVDDLLREVTDYGAERAKVFVAEMEAVYTSQLSNGIAATPPQQVAGAYSIAHRVAFIRTNTWYAAYVEFGTGVDGEALPHPESQMHGWEYDVNRHGGAGWLYYNVRDGRRHWTTGYPSRPFMYMTRIELENMAANIAANAMQRLGA